MDEPTAASAGRKPRILVVEDAFLFAAMLMYMLTELGCECVGPTGHAEEAIAFATNEALDAALISAPLRCAAGVAAILIGRQIAFGVIVQSLSQPVAGPLGDARRILKPYDLADVQLLLRELLPGVRFGRDGPAPHG